MGKNKKRNKNDSDSNDGSDSNSDSSGGGRVIRRKGKNPKKQPPKKEYKIFFSVDIRMTGENDLENKISKINNLKEPFSEIFKVKSEEDVFNVKTRIRPGGKAFKLEFGIKIATRMHPADYINIFDELSNKKDPQIQNALEDAFGLDNEPEIHIWEARYEKVDKGNNNNQIDNNVYVD
eukprot:383275_1